MRDTKSVHVVIEGRVQGVFYRAWTRERAQALGVSGWVRNRADGAVEAVFSGTSEAVDGLVEECRRGPPAARVDDITLEPAEPTGDRFEVRD